MGLIKLDGLPVEQPAAEPWPVDEHTICVDEMFARQLDSEFAGQVRGLLHDSETGVAAQRGEAALEAIAGSTGPPARWADWRNAPRWKWMMRVSRTGSPA